MKKRNSEHRKPLSLHIERLPTDAPEKNIAPAVLHALRRDRRGTARRRAFPGRRPHDARRRGGRRRRAAQPHGHRGRGSLHHFGHRRPGTLPPRAARRIPPDRHFAGLRLAAHRPAGRNDRRGARLAVARAPCRDHRRRGGGGSGTPVVGPRRHALLPRLGLQGVVRLGRRIADLEDARAGDRRRGNRSAGPQRAARLCRRTRIFRQ